MPQPMSLPRIAEPHTPDVSSLSIGLTLTPSSKGKRLREDEWAAAELDILKTLLARPPRDDLHFPPGAMPPPGILDELTTFVFVTYRHRKGAAMNGESNGTVQQENDGSPNDDNPPLAAVPDAMESDSSDVSDDTMDISLSSDGSDYPECNSTSMDGVWPHSWETTRRMLTHLALAETRFGAEREAHKLTRRERLARRNNLKRVNSMDFLDEELSAGENDREIRDRERLGRVQRLSTNLQNSQREPTALSRATSFGGESRASAPSRPVPTHDQRSALGLGIGLPMRRGSSGRSISSVGSSRRPSLLARGKSFTAQDLEDEELAESQVIEIRKRKPGDGSDTEEDEPMISPAIPPPTKPLPPPRLIRSLSEMSRPRVAVPTLQRPGSEEPKASPPRTAGLGLGEPLHLGGSLEYAKINSAGLGRRNRRPTGPTLAMTAMAGAAAMRSPSGSITGSAGPALGEESNGLRSPFEERKGAPLP